LHEIEFYRPYRFAFKIRDFDTTTKPLKSLSDSLLLLQVRDSKMMDIDWLKIKALHEVLPKRRFNVFPQAQVSNETTD